MKDFISVMETKVVILEDKYGKFRKGDGCAHNVATFFDGLKVDKKNDVYVNVNSGAIVGNVDVPIKSVDELEKFKDRKTGKNPYQHFLDLRDKGYILVVGRPFPSQHGGAGKNERGIYCKNYLEIAEKERRIEKMRKERLKTTPQDTLSL